MADGTFAEFEETVTLAMPRISDKLVEFSEANGKGHGLIVEVAAIHSGLTANYNFYSTQELERSVKSWVSPYPKPIILNHDQNVDPIGRVMAARMDHEADGSPFTRLQIAITDPSSVEKIADHRYLTGSVGGKSEAANCSICGKDWAEAKMFGPSPCSHQRGKDYKGRLAYLERKDLSFKEYSFVNSPADNRSMVIPASEGGETTEGWVTAARFFDLNMDKEEIVEYAESESKNVLLGMKKRESSPFYLTLKGAFLSSLAESEKLDDRENSAVENTQEELDDVLAVTEELSGDLAGTDAEEAQAEEAPAEETDETVEGAEENGDGEFEDGATVEPVSTDASEAAEGDEDSQRDEADAEEGQVTDEPDTEEGAKGGQRPQAQEKAHTADVSDKTNHTIDPSPKPSAVRGADRTRESDEANEEGDEATAADEAVEEGTEVQERDSMATEKAEELERRVAELTAQEEKLTEENARLRKALHRVLAERLVDTKIALGLVQSEEREEMLAEHVTRTASSLADSIRDLASQVKVIPTVANYANVPTMQQTDAVINDDGSVAEGEEVAVEKTVDPEELMVDVFMGRRPL